MEKIRRDFVVKELRSLALLMILMAAALGYIIAYVRVSPLAVALIPLIITVFVLRMQRQASGSFARDCGRYSELWQSRLEKEYAAPHPVYKVAYGEIHMLETCLVCRNKRRLIFIPVEQITGVERRFRSVGAKKVPLLKFRLDTDRTVDIDFSAAHTGDAGDVLGWLSARNIAAGPQR